MLFSPERRPPGRRRGAAHSEFMPQALERPHHLCFIRRKTTSSIGRSLLEYDGSKHRPVYDRYNDKDRQIGRSISPIELTVFQRTRAPSIASEEVLQRWRVEEVLMVHAFEFRLGPPPTNAAVSFKGGSKHGKVDKECNTHQTLFVCRTSSTARFRRVSQDASSRPSLSMNSFFSILKVCIAYVWCRMCRSCASKFMPQVSP